MNKKIRILISLILLATLVVGCGKKEEGFVTLNVATAGDINMEEL